MNVPFLDLNWQYQQIKDELHQELPTLFETSRYILGPYVESFEEHFANYIGTKYAVGVNSGTAALHTALLAMGIEEGDEIITPSHTFFATIEAIKHVGAIPIFCEIEETSYNLDPSKIEALITPKTKAILPVHMYGKACDMQSVIDIAEQHNLLVLEDSCQSHGATIKGKKAGSFGLAGCFSFYPGKNLGAFGEGGAVCTNDETLAQKIRQLRDHGSPQKYVHENWGYNYRLAGIQGLVLDLKLKHLDQWNDLRRKWAKYYTDRLGNLPGIILPQYSEDHVYHLYVVRVANREKFQSYLQEKGIQSGIHYPIPNHLQKACDLFSKHQKAPLNITEKICKEIVSLPMGPNLTQEQMAYTCDTIQTYLHENIQPRHSGLQRRGGAQSHTQDDHQSAQTTHEKVSH